MLQEIYAQMTALTKVDSFCRDYYLRTGHYMDNPSVEEIRSLLVMWGKLDGVLSEKELAERLNDGAVEGLNEIFAKESLFFEEEKDVGILSANRYFQMVEHEHHYFEIEAVMEGTAIHRQRNQQVYLKKGDVVLVPPNIPHITQPVDSSTVVDLEIRLSTFEKTFRDILGSSLPLSSFFKNALYGTGLRECIILEDVLDETILVLLALIWKENENRSAIAGKKSEHLAESLLYHLAETVSEEHIFEACEYQNEEMYQIRAYMRENLSTVTLAELAKHFHRSTSALSKYIKMHSQAGFAELLQNMRLEHAADLLLATDLGVAEISFLVGYAGESHFISCFKEKYGMTPLRYRRSKRGIIRDERPF